MKLILVQSIIFILFFGIGTLFQNCANSNFFKTTDQNNNILPQNHPDLTPSSSSNSGVITLIDHKTIQSFFYSIFINEGSSQKTINELSIILSSEIIMQQNTFGYPCDPISSGDFSECNYSLANLSTPLSQSSSTIREASRVQTCRRITSNNDLLLAAIENIHAQNEFPNSSSILKALRLFYPALSEVDEPLNALIVLSNQMAQNEEDHFTQWRLIINIICESPYWELL